MITNETVAAVYHTHVEAEAAVKSLQKAGIDMRTLSIVAKDFETDDQVVGYYNTGDRMKRWGSMGAFWGGFWGLLFGSAFFAIPGIGPVLVAGPLVAWIVGALEGALAVGGIGVIGAALASIGVPKDSILRYETAIKSDQFLLIVHGTASEAAKAREILSDTPSVHLEFHRKEELVGAR
jgi:hypothetical protein